MEFSRLPYRVVADIYKVFASTTEKDRLHLQVTIDYSAKATDRSRPIELTLLTDGQAIPLHRNAQGELLNFPLQQELWEANPFIQTNQPRGNLSLSGSITLRYPGKLAESVGWYRTSLRQANAAGQYLSSALGLLRPTAKKIIFSFPEGGRSGVTLKTGTNTTTISADANGRYPVDISDPSLPDAAVIELAGEPLTIAIQ